MRVILLEPSFKPRPKLPCEPMHLICFEVRHNARSLVVGDVSFLPESVQVPHGKRVYPKREEEGLDDTIMVRAPLGLIASSGESRRCDLQAAL